MDVLWISPSMNHYKVALLEGLLDYGVSMEVVAGSGRLNEGDNFVKSQKIKTYEINVPKKFFSFHINLYKFLFNHSSRFNNVLVPFEKKNFLLILFLFLTKRVKQFKLVTYCHEYTRNSQSNVTTLDKILTSFFSLFFDKIILYTQHSYVRRREISYFPQKYHWANNTLRHFDLSSFLPGVLSQNLKITFIGRLIRKKGTEHLLGLYLSLLDKFENFEFNIIGSGPDMPDLRHQFDNLDLVKFHGSMTDESQIKKVIQGSHFVVVPGASGLSINHSFLYGVPYLTLGVRNHGPEIDFVRHGVTGYICSDIEEMVRYIHNAYHDKKMYSHLQDGVIEVRKSLSYDLWCQRITNVLLID